MTRNPDDYPRRGRVIGGRAVHALPAKGHYDPRYPKQRWIIARAACTKQFDLRRGRDDVLSPDTDVTCVACNRALGVVSEPSGDAPGAVGGLASDHPINVLLAAAAVAEEIADAATEGPWLNLDRGDRLIHLRDDDGFEYVVDEPMSHEGNAAHITLWQPPVARAVAAWLRACAATWPTQTTYTTTPTRSAERRAALDTARALLTAKDNT